MDPVPVAGGMAHSPADLAGRLLGIGSLAYTGSGLKQLLTLAGVLLVVGVMFLRVGRYRLIVH